MTNPTPLSPAAQAVLDAYYTEADLRNREVTDHEMLAAALRAAGDQLVPGKLESCGIRYELLRIAEELEAQ